MSHSSRALTNSQVGSVAARSVSSLSRFMTVIFATEPPVVFNTSLSTRSGCSIAKRAATHPPSDSPEICARSTFKPSSTLARCRTYCAISIDTMGLSVHPWPSRSIAYVRKCSPCALRLRTYASACPPVPWRSTNTGASGSPDAIYLVRIPPASSHPCEKLTSRKLLQMLEYVIDSFSMQFQARHGGYIASTPARHGSVAKHGLSSFERTHFNVVSLRQPARHPEVLDS